ncbi:hypothetical protein F4X86_01845 [Candidatus Saccharibacteria bacterium]|nr:hypothetical protein [Candidatus Saccharibacteria bacterium]
MRTAIRPVSKYVIIAAALLAAALYLAPAVSAQQGVVTPDNPETRAPVLSIVQNNTALSVLASDDNLDSNTWQAAGPFAQEPTCDSDGLVYGPADPHARFLTLTPADNGKWYCFKVADTDGNYGYAKFEVLGVTVEEEVVEEEAEEMPEPEIASEPLALSVSQSGNSLLTVVNRENYAGEIQVTIVSGTTDCVARSFDRSPRSVFSGRQVSGLSWRDNGKWYCFRTAEDGSYAYGLIQVSGLPVPAGVDAAPAEQPAPEEGEEEAEEAETETAEDEQEEEGAGSAEGDDGEEDNALRLVGIIVAVVGIVAIMAVILFSRRQSEQNIEDSDDDF